MASIDKRIIKLVKTLEWYRVDHSYIHRAIMHLLDEELPEVPVIESDSDELDEESELDDSPDEVTHLGKFTLGDQVWFLGDISGRIHRGTIKKLFPLTQNALMVMSDSHWGCVEIGQLQWDENNLITNNDNLNTFKRGTNLSPTISHLIIRSEYWWMDTTNPDLPCKRWGDLVGILNDKPDGVTALIAEQRHSTEWGQTFVLHRVNPANLTVKGH